jgi:hypothetical protein
MRNKILLCVIYTGYKLCTNIGKKIKTIIKIVFTDFKGNGLAETVKVTAFRGTQFDYHGFNQSTVLYE